MPTPLGSVLGSGSGVPVGGLIELPGQGSSNPTINGAEYLKTSVLKPVVGYESLAASAPYLSLVLGTRQQNLGTSSIYGLAGTNNGFVYALSSGPARWASSVSGAFNSVGGSFGWSNFCVMGANLVGPTTGAIQTITNSSVANFTPTINQLFCAANTAQSLMVSCSTGNFAPAFGDIVTSTNGTTFTERTPSLTVGGQMRFLMWCQVAGTFLFVNDAANVWSTTDGFTLTARGQISGVTYVATVPAPSSNGWASSATSTIFLAPASFAGGSSVAAMFRTTNGTSFTATPLSTLLGLDGFITATAPDRIARVGSDWIMWGNHSQFGEVATVYRSTDDGVTWAKSALWVDTALPNVGSFLLGQGTGPATTFIASTSAAASNLISITSPTAATHVGLSNPALAHFDRSGTRYLPLYLRLK